MAQLYRKGTKGLEVARIQSALNVYGAKPQLKVDGDFGADTENAVRAFQTANGIKPVDGIVGPITRGYLYPFRTLTVSGVMQRGPINKSPRAPRTSSSSSSSSSSPSPSNTTSTTSSTSSSASGSPGSSQPLKLTPPSVGGGKWVQQVQAGGQVAFAPWLNTGSPQSAVRSGVLTMQFTYQTRPEGRHFELSPILQLAINSQSKSTDPLFTYSAGGQVTWADIYAPGSWHILSPYVQIMGLAQNSDGKLQLGVQGSIGNQITYEAKKDRLMFFLQGSLAGTYTNDGNFTLGPQVTLGAIGQF
jgi:hypothetical protein